jgi:hypothetical protein
MDCAVARTLGRDYSPRLESGVSQSSGFIGFVREVALRRFRRFTTLAVMLVAVAGPRLAAAAPEVHRFNLVLSGNPTQLVAGDLNEFINDYNRFILEPRGLEALDNISFGWYQQAEFRYFVRPNWAVTAGAGQIRSQSRREYLPRIAQVIVLRTDVVSVPVHVGGAYYLAPYTQGDFQARAYLGGGFMSLTNNKIVFEQLEFQTDSATTLGGSTRSKLRRDGPGFYLEAGGHMFFASRYSVMIGLIYRSAVVREMREVEDIVEPGETGTVTQIRHSEPSFGLDTGGLGFRMAVGIGL